MTTLSTFSRLVRNSIFLATLAALFFVAADARAQANHNVTRSNKTLPAAATGLDNDCDGVCGAVHGAVRLEGQQLVLIIDQAGGTFARVLLADGGEPDRSAELDPTPIYMSINDGVHLVENSAGVPGTTTATAASQDYNSSRSNRTGRAADGTLEHTDDWIAARAAATVEGEGSTGPAYTKDLNSARSNVSSLSARTTADSFFDVTFEHIPTDVHSGRLTGVRQHSPYKVRTAVDAATPAIYRATLDASDSFTVLLPPAAGTYRVVVKDGRGQTYRGHVTVLK